MKPSNSLKKVYKPSQSEIPIFSNNFVFLKSLIPNIKVDTFVAIPDEYVCLTKLIFIIFY